MSGVLGKAFHQAMEVYYGGVDEFRAMNEAEAIEFGLKSGMDFLNKYNDGFINYSKTIPNKQKIFDYFSFCFTEYVKMKPYNEAEVLGIEEQIKETISVQWRGKELVLPIPLKGYIDKVIRVNGKLKIIDYKTCYKFSDPDAIEGAKIIQAVVYYLLVYAKYKEEPYSVIFEEVKYIENKVCDKRKECKKKHDAEGKHYQVEEYEIVFAKNDLYFDFFFRMYEDIVRALNGEMVFVPNIDTNFDNEVSIVSYIHRLDVSEETAKLMKKHKVETLTELLKKEIQSAGNMRSLLKSVEEQFVSAKNMDYKNKKTEEKIQLKMLEHGMALSFDSVIEGSTVDLYQYTPTIGLKMSRIRNFVDDVEQVLGVSGIRVLAPISGTSLVGFEVPRVKRQFITNSVTKKGHLIVGLDILGKEIVLNIEEMPHLLVAGSTGSGKSVFLNEVIKQTSGHYDITILDPKGVDFESSLNDHYEIAEFTQSLVKDMKVRYEIMKEKKVKKWKDTGRKSLMVVIDEYNDLYMSREKIQIGTRTIIKKSKKLGDVQKEVPVFDTVGNVVSRNVKLLAQKARSAGIHLVLATQRPSVKVIDGDIKSNFVCRVSFRLPTETDSKVVLDQAGAEKLQGKGDGLLLKDGIITRFQAFSN